MARQRGQITAHSNFDIVAFIRGPLTLRIKPKLKIAFYEKCDHPVPAFVNFFRGDNTVVLNVCRTTWDGASAGIARDRYILAHEIGHILMHSHNELAYSKSIPSIIAGLPETDRTEPQADLFADLFLVPETLLEGFSCADDIADYFNVPLDCAIRRYEHIMDHNRRKLSRRYTGDSCRACANFTLVRNGTCLKCDTCGSTIGCS